MNATWRDAEHADLPEIERLWEEQKQRFAEIAPTVRSEMPVLFMPEELQDHPLYPFQPPVLRVRVCERRGEVVAAKIVEAVCEVQLIGGDQEVVNSLSRELPEECQWAKARGFKSGWGLAPLALATPIERSLRRTPLRAWRNMALIGCDFEELGD